jgi:hypothetical protein
LEKWDGNLEDVVYGAFFLQLRQDEFAEEYPLNFIELLGRIPISKVGIRPKGGVPYRARRYPEVIKNVTDIFHLAPRWESGATL